MSYFTKVQVPAEVTVEDNYLYDVTVKLHLVPQPDLSDLSEERKKGYYCGEWFMFGITATIHIKGNEVGSMSIWNLPTDNYESPDVLDGEINCLIEEALGDARDNIARLAAANHQ